MAALVPPRFKYRWLCGFWSEMKYCPAIVSEGAGAEHLAEAADRHKGEQPLGRSYALLFRQPNIQAKGAFL